MKLKKIYYALPIFILAMVMVGFVATQPSNSLTMDVNPSIEIVTNRLDRVVEINPLNKDADDLLREFNPKNKNLEDTVNDLVDLMILTGHIKGGADNFVMITVDDDSMDSNLVRKVNRAIAAMLENKQIEATVLNQAIARSEDGRKLTGVELAASRLEGLDGDMDGETLANMTVRQLIHYSKDQNIPIESLFRVAAGTIDNTLESRVMISREEAERIALGKIDGEIIKFELDDLHDDDGPEYEIEILAKDGKYEIEIDAFTGVIKEFERDDHDSKEDRTQAAGSFISPEEARKIALGLVNGEIIKLELDDDEDDDPEYEIKVRKDGVIYEIELDARSGRVEEFERNDDDDKRDPAPKDKPASSTNSRISPDQAKSIALEMTGGGRITEFEWDDDEYEIEIIKDGMEYEIEIHAYTGRVLDFEVEDDD